MARAGGADQPWRASLEDTLTGQRRGFADLEALVAYLRDKIEGESAQSRNLAGARPTIPEKPCNSCISGLS